MTVKRVALLTAGGYAPCLSSAVGGLIERYNELVPDVEIIAYKHGYWGLLSGEKIVVDDEVRLAEGVRRGLEAEGFAYLPRAAPGFACRRWLSQCCSP